MSGVDRRNKSCRHKWLFLGALNGHFLAPLLIFIKKVGLLQYWSSASSALTFTCGHDNLKKFSCILPKFVMHVTNDQFSDKFNNDWKKIQKSQNGWFIAFLHILCQYFDLVGAITWKVFHVSSSNLLCRLLISSSWKSSEKAEKQSKMADLLRFSAFYVNNLTLWAR